MYRALGYSGMDVGGTHDFATFQDILRRAAKIGAEWELHKDNLCFPPPNAFYLYNTTGEEAMLSRLCTGRSWIPHTGAFTGSDRR